MHKALILIIDESDVTRAMYGDYFRHHGFAVVEAASGTEGLRLFRQRRPDLIVTELSDRPEWMQSIRSIRALGGRNTGMIACSTTIDATWPVAPPGLDVDVALAKPTSPRALLDQARHLLGSLGHEASAIPA
jgi:DNA-binding response OmpR family regulator